MMLKQKKGFLVRDFVLAGILFGIVIALFIISVGSIATNYNNTDMVSPQFAAHYNKLQSNLNSLDSAYLATKGSGGLNLIGTFNVVFNSVFTVITMAWDGIAMYSGMATNISGDFSFLDQATALLILTSLIACILIPLIFVWLSSVSRGKI